MKLWSVIVLIRKSAMTAVFRDKMSLTISVIHRHIEENIKIVKSKSPLYKKGNV